MVGEHAKSAAVEHDRTPQTGLRGIKLGDQLIERTAHLRLFDGRREIALGRFEQVQQVHADLSGTCVEDTSAIGAALDLYKLDNLAYPSTEQGLEALVRKPADLPAGQWVLGWRWDCEETTQVRRNPKANPSINPNPNRNPNPKPNPNSFE